MCGIAGFWDLTENSNENSEERGQEILETMADQMIHRGPDGKGFYYNTQNGLGLAHTRLSIIDLQTGKQPIQDPVADSVLAANGEFYEYKHIRGQLVTEGHQFTTKSDSEIALKLYQKHGLDFTEHLRGEFAFALYDGKKEELILVRDRFGIRPLFYHASSSFISFASELKALTAHPKVPRELNKKAVVHQMMQVMVPGQTLFENVQALKPGHMLIIKKRGNGFEIREKQYWDADFPTQGQHSQESEETLINNVREKMIESVALRLEADVPVACYLSGGIDSCSILGMASAIQQSPVKGFTISFDDDRYDESSIATEMANSCGADQDILRLKAADLYGKNFEKALWHSERTFYNTLGVAKMLMSQHVTKNGYKVVITGEGSDEIFGGYAAFKRDMFLHDPATKSLDMEAKLKASNQLFSGSILAEKEVSHPAFNDLIGFTPSWIQPWMLTLENVKNLLSREYRDLLEDYDPIATIAESLSPEALRGRHPLDQSQYTWMKTMLEGQILNWGGDRVDMAYSLESRPAFLDHHVVNMAINIPPHIRIKDGIEKWVLREAMKNILPETLYRREKFAFMAPPSHTDQAKKNAINALIEKHVCRENTENLQLIDSDQWNRFLKEHSEVESHSSGTRNDIIINHVVQMHALQPMLFQS